MAYKMAISVKSPMLKVGYFLITVISLYSREACVQRQMTYLPHTSDLAKVTVNVFLLNNQNAFYELTNKVLTIDEYCRQMVIIYAHRRWFLSICHLFRFMTNTYEDQTTGFACDDYCAH